MENIENKILEIEPTLIGYLDNVLCGMDATISEVASAIPSLKKPIMDRVNLIKKIEISEESVGSVKDGVRDVKNVLKLIDTFRISSKKRVLEHYEPIETVCKDLQAEINDELAPIKAGIEEYEEEARIERENLIHEWINEAVEAEGLDESYRDKIVIENKWFRASKKAVIRETTEQLNTIRHKESIDKMLRESYQSIIDIENRKMKHEMKLSDFNIEGKTQAEVLEEITTQAEKFREIENAVKNEAVAEVNNTKEDEVNVKEGFLIRIFEDASRTEEVIQLLNLNGFIAIAE